MAEIAFSYKNSKGKIFFLRGIDVTPRNWKKTIRFYYFFKFKNNNLFGAVREEEGNELLKTHQIIENPRSGLPLLKRLPHPTV